MEELEKEYIIEGILSKEVMDVIINFGDIFIIQLETVKRICCKECECQKSSVQAFKQSKYNVYAVNTEASKDKREMSILMKNDDDNSILYVEVDKDGEAYITERDNVVVKLTEKEAYKTVKELNKMFCGNNYNLKRKI